MRIDAPTLVMRISLAVAFLMLAGKLTAYFITDSLAILSDAAESVVHLGATVVATFSLWYSRQPADRGHPYGHGKIAFFSAGLEGGLIFIAAVYIVWIAVVALVQGPQPRRLGLGLAIIGVLGAVNLLLGLSLVRVGKKHGSLVVVANGKHVLTDMWTSLAVLIGVAVVWFTGLLWLDPVVAIGAGVNIMVSAVGLARRAYGGLLDEANPETTQKIVECLDGACAAGTISDFHQLRHRESDRTLWVELHMLLPRDMPVHEAHQRVTEVEKSIVDRFPQSTVHVTTHVEPHIHEEAHPDGHPGLPDPLDTPSHR